MKSVSLSKTSRWHKVLDALGGFADGADTLCDITRNILVRLGVLVFGLLILVVFLLPYGDTIGWLAYVAMNGWTAPNYVMLVCDVVYAMVAFNLYLDFKKKKVKDVIHFNRDKIPRPLQAIDGWLNKDIVYDSSKWWHRILNDFDILNWSSTENPRIIVFLRAIGFCVASLLMIVCILGIVVPPLSFIIWFAYVGFHNWEWFMPHHLLVQAWGTYFFLMVLAVFFYGIPWLFGKGAKAVKNNEFAVSLWYSIKNKTCVKFEVKE